MGFGPKLILLGLLPVPQRLPVAALHSGDFGLVLALHAPDLAGPVDRRPEPERRQEQTENDAAAVSQRAEHCGDHYDDQDPFPELRPGRRVLLRVLRRIGLGNHFSSGTLAEEIAHRDLRGLHVLPTPTMVPREKPTVGRAVNHSHSPFHPRFSAYYGETPIAPSVHRRRQNNRLLRLWGTTGLDARRYVSELRTH